MVDATSVKFRTFIAFRSISHGCDSSWYTRFTLMCFGQYDIWWFHGSLCRLTCITYIIDCVPLLCPCLLGSDFYLCRCNVMRIKIKYIFVLLQTESNTDSTTMYRCKLPNEPCFFMHSTGARQNRAAVVKTMNSFILNTVAWIPKVYKKFNTFVKYDRKPIIRLSGCLFHFVHWGIIEADTLHGTKSNAWCVAMIHCFTSWIHAV